MSGAEPVIELSDVSKIYGQGQLQVRAMNQVSFNIFPGEFVAIMGPSGSGKSTCMNMLGFLDNASAGSYRFAGVEVGRLDRDGLAMLRRHFVSFIFQSFNLLARTSALENVELPMVYRGVKRRLRRRRALEALAAVGLAQRYRNTPAQLSGGEQQRVAIARALVGDPLLLLADEPTGSLDTARTEEIIQLLLDLNQSRGLTIVMVTHEPEVAQHAKRVLFFTDGRLVADGPPAEVLR